MTTDMMNELARFCIYLAVGEVLILVYDVLRILRILFRHARLVVILEDIAYWALATGYIFYMMLRLNNGTIRGYGVLAMIAGMVFYHCCVSNVWIEPICILLKRGLKKISKIGRIRVRNRNNGE